MRFADRISATLEDLEARTLLRSPRMFEGPGPRVEIDGRTVVGLASNDYLGFAADPRLLEPLARAKASGAGASRLISGTMTVHGAAERSLADFVQQPAALLFSSGYAANVGAVQALLGPRDIVFSDALNHASIIDGCRLSRARVLIYRHADLEHLSALLTEHRTSGQAALIASETVFSMDGDLANVRALRELADRHDAGLLLDEAHAFGVVGTNGRGVALDAGVRADVVVGTLGKSFGLMGAFVAGSSDLTRLLTNRARSFVFSTGISPAIAAAIPTATRLVLEADDRRARLRHHAHRIRETVRATHAVPDSPSCIVPVILGQPAAALHTAARLLERGVFAQAIRPPTVPEGTSRLRLAPSAAHHDQDIDHACDALRRVLGS